MKFHGMGHLIVAIFAALQILTCVHSAQPTDQRARILAVMPFSGRSHMNIYRPLLTELAERGHEVVSINPFPMKKPVKNLREIHTKFMEEFLSSDEFNAYEEKNTTIFTMFGRMTERARKFCVQGLELPEIQQLIKSDEKFDLIIYSVFLSDCYLGFVHKFKAPFIMISPSSSTLFLNYAANPLIYSYMPNALLPYTDKMNFKERLINTLAGVAKDAVVSFLYLPTQDEVMKEYFGESTPSAVEIQKNVSLVLINSHVSYSYPKPNLPSVIEIGGIHLKSSKELPKDLKTFLDGAIDGAVYFSLGSNVRTHQMPSDKLQIFLDVFAQFPQKFVMKWEADVLPGQPKNVKIGKWLPQTDILAHPNVKVFISHGGLLSSQESLYHGVCVLGIPFMADQGLNIQRMERNGLGVQLDFNTMTRESLLKALKTLLEDSSYTENAKRLSAVFKDQIEHPLDRAVFWTEYVIRHKGAHHMRSAAVDLAWYQYFLLDVIAVILFAALLILLLSYIVLRTLVRLVKSLCGGKTSQKKKKQ